MATIKQRDPTMTTGVRGQYTAEMRRRFRRVKALVLETVIENDALRVGKVPGVRLEGVRFAGNARAADKYTFPSDVAGKAAAFMEWLRGAVEEELLGITQGDARKVVAREAWQDIYIRAAYGKGLAAADATLKRMGIDVPDMSISGVFTLPVHADTLALLFTRNFEELNGVSQTMASQISRALAEGLAQGKGPREIGKRMGDLIDGLSRTRGEVIARTEIIRTWNEGALNRYEEFGISGVTPLAEFATAPQVGDYPCDECVEKRDADIGYGKGIYPIAQARGLIPVHPNCLPGDALVAPVGSVTGVSKRWYDGNLVIIRTASGQQISSTLHHPVLTERGWVPAHLLHIGDHVVRYGGGDGEFFGNDETQNVPARIEEIAETFFRAREVTTGEVPVSAEDFHGDGGGSQVAIIGANRFLKGIFNAPFGKQLPQFPLMSTDMQLPGFDSLSMFEFGIKRNGTPTGGNMRGGCELLPFICAHPFHSQNVGLASVSHFNASLLQAVIDGVPIHTVPFRQGQDRLPVQILGNDLGFRQIAPAMDRRFTVDTEGDPGIYKPAANDILADAQLARNILGGAFGPVLLDEIIEIEMRDFSGHVYNLETETGFYLANKIITHNCRCAWLPVIPKMNANQAKNFFTAKGTKAAKVANNLFRSHSAGLVYINPANT